MAEKWQRAWSDATAERYKQDWSDDEVVRAVYDWWTYDPMFAADFPNDRSRRIVAGLADKTLDWTIDPQVDRHFWLFEGGILHNARVLVGEEKFDRIAKAKHADLYSEIEGAYATNPKKKGRKHLKRYVLEGHVFTLMELLTALNAFRSDIPKVLKLKRGQVALLDLGANEPVPIRRIA